jgi:dihydrofolate reductase
MSKDGKIIVRKIIAITHVALDGIMQSPGGPDEDPRGDFTQGGWIWSFGDESMGEVLSEIMSNEFDMLLGRRTYEIFSAYWPYAGDNLIANAFNKATKYVVTCSLEQLDWVNSKRIGGDVLEDVRRLKASDGPELHIWGSSELLQTLIAAELVDEFRVWIYPLILGKGKRLFENGVPPFGLTLVESRCAPKGVLFNTYRPAGPLPKGSFVLEQPSESEIARRKKLMQEDHVPASGSNG